MKTKYFKSLLILILIFVSFFSTNSLYSEDIHIGDKAPCTYWWPNLPWQGPGTQTMTINGCQYLIEFYYRINEVERQETQIVAIYKLYGDNCNISRSELWQAAYAKLWTVNPMSFNNTDDEYIAQQYPCIEFNTSSSENPINLYVPGDLIDTTGLLANYVILPNNDILFNNIDYYWPCQDSVCCAMFYRITRVAQKVVKIEWWDPGMGTGYQEPCDDTTRCAAACSDLKFNWYAPGYEPQGFMNIKEVPKPIDISIIYPNPNDGAFSLEFSSDMNGIIDFVIYNAQGKIIFVEQFEKNTSIIKKTFNLQKLSNGAFYYSINVNSYLRSFGSFVKK